MLSATIKHLIRDLLDLARRAEQFLLALGAERRCALRLDRVGTRLASMGDRIRQLRARLDGGTLKEALDNDGQLRESLSGLKDDIRTVRCQVASMRTPRLSARLQRAFAKLSRIIEDTYASADQLQWQIDEHDRRFSAETSEVNSQVSNS